MGIPTRIIEQPEFDELLRQNGGLALDFYLKPVAWLPPCPDHGYHGDPWEDKALHIFFLNVLEPVIYIDTRGNHKLPYVLLPISRGVEEYTFEQIAEIHPFGKSKDVWGYELGVAGEERCDLDETWWWFNNGPIPAYNKDKVETH